MKQSLLFSLLIILCSIQGKAQSSEIFKTREGIAIKGYDPVAFFTENKAVKGADSLQLMWKEAIWLFSSSTNRDAFRKSPEKYAPQFGGYCAYGVAGNHKSPTETDTWTIFEGQLYFNYNAAVKKLWLKDSLSYIQKANANWIEIKNK